MRPSDGTARKSIPTQMTRRYWPGGLTACPDNEPMEAFPRQAPAAVSEIEPALRLPTAHVRPDVRHRRGGVGSAGRRRSSSNGCATGSPIAGPTPQGSGARLTDVSASGTRRLSIVDLSPEANQPFLSADGRHAVVLNGEIYNFRALREELEAAGATFRTSSDTEVLLEAYRSLGRGVPRSPLRACSRSRSGTRTRSRLFCARDRAGEKPFYYAVVGDSFIFASELKSLLLWPGFRRELDYTARRRLPDVRVRPGSEEHLAGRRQASPGTFADGRPSTRTGRTSASRPSTGTSRSTPTSRSTDWGPAIRDALEQSAAEMSYADVPVGTFLSGGVDSSAVTAALAKPGCRCARSRSASTTPTTTSGRSRARSPRCMARLTPSGSFARTTSSPSFATRSSGTTTSLSTTTRTCRRTTSAVRPASRSRSRSPATAATSSSAATASTRCSRAGTGSNGRCRVP